MQASLAEAFRRKAGISSPSQDIATTSKTCIHLQHLDLVPKLPEAFAWPGGAC